MARSVKAPATEAVDGEGAAAAALAAAGSPKMLWYCDSGLTRTTSESESGAAPAAMVAPARTAALRAPVFRAGVGFGARFDGVSSLSLQSSSSSPETSDSEGLGSARGRLRLPGVRAAAVALVGVEVPDGRERQLATSPPDECVWRSWSASFLMPRNWNWIPSAVDWPKYLAISVAVG